MTKWSRNEILLVNWTQEHNSKKIFQYLQAYKKQNFEKLKSKKHQNQTKDNVELLFKWDNQSFFNMTFQNNIIFKKYSQQQLVPPNYRVIEQDFGIYLSETKANCFASA